MASIHINDTVLPDNPVHREAILETRRLIRAELRSATAPNLKKAQLLALLFGRSKRHVASLMDAADSTNPVQAAAQQLAAGAPSVVFGHDEFHIIQCQRFLYERIRCDKSLGRIVATDLGTLTALSRSLDMARSSEPILIEGGTGTGKGLLATAIHRKSGRDGEVLNFCAYGSRSELLADDLYGHERGAFPGARTKRLGLFEQAEGGTLVIDEIGELPLDLQASLLRVLETGTFRPLGGREKSVNVRLIATSRTSLAQLVREHKFREDLYFRLMGFRLHLPLLRDREHFFRGAHEEILKRISQPGAELQFTAAALDALCNYNWPGNLREFESVLRKALLYSGEHLIRIEHLPHQIRTRYLALSISERAQAFVFAQNHGEQLDAQLLTYRVERLVLTARKESVAREEEKGLVSLEEILRKVPDDDVEHKVKMKSLGEILHFIAEKRKTSDAIEALEQLSPPAGDETAPEVIKKALGQLHEDSHRLQEDAKKLPSIKSVLNSPWLRLLKRIDDNHRYLVDQGGDPSAPNVDAVKTPASLLNEVLILAKKHLTRLVGESDISLTPVEDALAFCSRRHSTWTEDEWRSLVANCRSKTEAVRVSGIDGRTISKFLRNLGIAENWGERLVVYSVSRPPKEQA